VGKTTIYALIADGAFPRPFRLSCRASRWSLAEVRAWIAALPRAGSLGSSDHQANRRELRHG
jgi:predicted DNA-binding transcriptional regulator AlpA